MAGICNIALMLILFSSCSVNGLYLIRSFYPHVDTSNFLYNPAISPFPVTFLEPSSSAAAAAAARASGAVSSGPIPPSDYPFSFPLPSSEKRFSKQPLIIPDWMNIGPY